MIIIRDLYHVSGLYNAILRRIAADASIVVLRSTRYSVPFAVLARHCPERFSIILYITCESLRLRPFNG